MVDWCIAELQYKAKIFEKTGAVSVYNGDVVKSDTAVSESLKESLQAAVELLEDVSARFQDWHPYSDEKVLDLVHPALFPLVYGQSKILPDGKTNLEDCIARCGEGVVIPVPPEIETQLVKNTHSYDHFVSNPYSAKFQWLPCDVDISGDYAK